MQSDYEWSKYTKWKAAMDKKKKSLGKNKIWGIVENIEKLIIRSYEQKFIWNMEN